MKVDPNVHNNNDRNGGSGNKKTLLPLVPEAATPLTKDNSVSLMIATDPSNMANSPKYKLSVLILRGGEPVRTMLQWKRDVIKVLHGMDISTGANQYLMVQSLMVDTPLTLFETKAGELATTAREAAAVAAEAAAPGTNAGAPVRRQPAQQHLTVDHIQTSLQHMLTQLLPRRVLQRVKRYLRRECRKPADMKVRIYMQHLLRVNMGELEQLPPFRANQALSTDELLDIMLFGTPKSWQKEMERQGFDPLLHTLSEVIDFMERIEASEDFDASKNNGQDKKKAPSNKRKGGKMKDEDESIPRKKFCLLHGYGNHDSDACEGLKRMVKRQKEDSGDKTDKKKGSPNKSWKRKANDSTAKNKKDLAAFVKKAVADGIQKELSDKKRKVDDELDMNAIECDLKGFNYEDMDKLQIASDDDGEVSV